MKLFNTEVSSDDGEITVEQRGYMIISQKIPVLVIVEKDVLRESIRTHLDSNGFKVYLAVDVGSGIQAASKYKPRLILLDVAEGLEDVVSEFKLSPQTGHIPVIVLTEGDSVECERQVCKVGADDYITKPFAHEILGEIVKLKLENCEAVIQKGHHRDKNSVLIIDDESDIRKLIKHNLIRAGFEVFTAEDGPSGIKAARKHKPHLILLDVMMPGMSGLEVLFNLKWNKKTKHIPVFMLTAKNSMGDIDHAFARRADDYLTKPFDGEKLGKTIKEKLAKLKQLAKLK